MSISLIKLQNDFNESFTKEKYLSWLESLNNTIIFDEVHIQNCSFFHFIQSFELDIPDKYEIWVFSDFVDIDDSTLQLPEWAAIYTNRILESNYRKFVRNDTCFVTSEQIIEFIKELDNVIPN